MILRLTLRLTLRLISLMWNVQCYQFDYLYGFFEIGPECFGEKI